MLGLIVLAVLALVLLYLQRMNQAIATAPAEAVKFCEKDWTNEQQQEAYRKAQSSPTDVKPFLFSKKNRRYVVVGGSGLVGGWIVHHLMMRGEDPAAIRIIDLSPTKREEALQANIDFVKTDVSDFDAVVQAFKKPWPEHVKSLPLTVFHCVAYINPSDRKSDFVSMYIKVNILGTQNVLKVAQATGASCFIATSSASVGVRTPSYFTWPWRKWPKDVYQFLPNAEPRSLDAPLGAFTSCYAWSKAQAEKIVRNANDPQAGFFTGAIRPGHAIYGHGVENFSSVTWDYLRRGGTPSWIPNVVAHFVSAQNVSIGHLAYEDALLGKKHTGGKSYLVTDPNPPIRFRGLYRILENLAHPLTPVKFPYIPFMPMLFVAYAIETYSIVRSRYLSFLPKVTGDVAFVQPAMFHMCTVHIVYDDTPAQKEIGYRAPITTLEGFAHAVLDWNQKIEMRAKEKVKAGKGGEVQVQDGSNVPKGPNMH